MWRVSVYRDKILLLVFTVGSFASMLGIIVSLLISAQSVLWWIFVLIAIAVVLFALMVLSIVVALKSDTPTRWYRFDDQDGIRNYLYNWLESGGRVAIWTRDMSWADDEEMTQLLSRKASSQELIICLPNDIEKSDVLKQRGAEVIAYGTWDAPSTSFTIVNFNRAGSRVAVGRRSDNLHIIQEFSADEHPAFHMAQDLVRLVRERNNAG